MQKKTLDYDNVFNMGGTVLETKSEKLIRQGMYQGKAKMLIEMEWGEYGLDDATILKRMQDKIGRSVIGTGNHLFESVWKTACVDIGRLKTGIFRELDQS